MLSDWLKYLMPLSSTSDCANKTIIVSYLHIACMAGINRNGEGAQKTRGEKERNACYKNQAILIMPTDFLRIELRQLLIPSPIRNWWTLWLTADFTWEFTSFTAQHELFNRNFVATSVHRNEPRGSLLQATFPSLPSSPLPNACYVGYLHMLSCT